MAVSQPTAAAAIGVARGRVSLLLFLLLVVVVKQCQSILQPFFSRATKAASAEGRSSNRDGQLQQCVGRRDLIHGVISTVTAATAVFWPLSPAPCLASTEEEGAVVQEQPLYERRPRDGNKKALIREDYWYMTGRIPPRKLEPGTVVDDPKFNAWGACATSETGATNSCLYVSLSQRIPAYSKYSFNINLGAQQYGELGKVISQAEGGDATSWDKIARLVDRGEPGRYPSPTVDALLKMALMATGLLTSPNYTGPQLQLLVARFYVNEISFALSEIEASVEGRDVQRAKAAYDFGRDSWNSYFTLINTAIAPKVGEKFDKFV